MLSMLGKIFSRQHFKIYFSYFSQKTCYFMQIVSTFHAKMSPFEKVCMKFLNLFCRKKKSIINLLSAELAQREVEVNISSLWECYMSVCFKFIRRAQ